MSISRSKSTILILFSLTLQGCQNIAPTPAVETLSPEQCQADSEFAFVPAGEFGAGSDRRERDHGYRISAEVSVGKDQSSGEDTEEQAQKIAQLEQKLAKKRWFESEPNRSVETLPDFCISRNLVTNRDYQAFVASTGYRSPDISEADYQKQGFLVHPYTEVEPYRWSQQTYPAGESDHPVVLVSYEDAVAYLEWKGAEDNRTYRLPTALEWEKAARGTDNRYFPWGDDWQENGTNAANSGLWHTSPIASFPLSRSVYGVEDMAGNVFEFTSTLKQRNLKTVSVMKGCSWDDLVGFCRSAYQHTRPVESRHILFGFRAVWLD